MDRPLATGPIETHPELKHLRYELDMLRATAELLRYTGDGAIKNAFLESFAIHTRALIHFYFPGPSHRTGDLRAAEYCNPETPWPHGSIPDDNKLLREAKTRADKQIAHLTKDRGNNASVGKLWDAHAILAELENLEQQFYQLATPEARAAIWE